VEAADFEAWGKVVVERAAQLILAAIPAEQQPQPGKTARRSLGGTGFISRHVLFLQPDLLAPRALWLFAVPAGHAYDFRPAHDRVGAGLMHDASSELSSSRFAAGMTRSGGFAWKMHLETRHEGYRLALKVDPETQDPEAAGTELAEQILAGFRRIGLIEEETP
jgi:hypothetical protein